MSETSEITGPLVKMLRQMGIVTLRLNSGKVKVRGGWMQLCPEGTPDILCFARDTGAPVWIETKALKGNLREKQVEMRARLLALGHKYHEVRSIDAGLDAVRAK